MKVYIDGQFFDEADAKISVFDHGLLYGDGVFEGIRMYHNRIFKLREHIERLYWSAKAILLEIPLTPEQMMQACVDTCRANGLRDGYIRLIVTRGKGTLGLDPRRCPKPSVIVIASTIQLYPEKYYEEGLNIVTVPTTRNLVNSVNPAIKSLNYLNNILARIEANLAGVEEAIMLNTEGFVAECTGDNIFLLHKGRLVTPPLSAGALYGITRGTVLDCAKELGIPWAEPNLTRYDVYIADEMFLTGTAAEMVPVVKVDGRVIGTGKPGPITKKLIEAFRAKTALDGELIFT
ncbi:MAG TPA: branched-chain-amino-acid transaminase [Candidatus Limnocylindria bacterium]|jgi:branched-chain amino acid aminotransferase|nr:branched-chain-amino-acid transaminase [Candidatus Limnocylindria bacterium]